MKRLLGISTIFALICTTTVSAQDDDSRTHIHGGLKAGFNFSSMIREEEPNFDVDTKLGYVAGAFVAIPIGKFLGFQPEVLISEKGFNSNGTSIGGNYTFSRTTTYLDVPLLLQIKPSQHFTLLVGPQYSYILSKKDEVQSSDVVITDQVTYDNDDITKNLLGVVVGADIYIGHLLIFGRYNLDLRSNNGDGTQSVPEYKNQVFQIGAGLVF